MKVRKYTINGHEYEVAVNSVTGNHAEVTVNGVKYQVETGGTGEKSVQAASVAVQSPVQKTSPVPAGHGRTVDAPLPGVIVSLAVSVGDAVKAGQVVAVLEAMKMENEIQAEWDGTVTAVNVSKGDSVLEGTPVVTIG